MAGERTVTVWLDEGEDVRVFAEGRRPDSVLSLVVEPVDHPADRFELVATRWETLRLGVRFVLAAIRPPARRPVSVEERDDLEIPF